MRQLGLVCASLGASLLVAVGSTTAARSQQSGLELTTTVSPTPVVRNRPATIELRVVNHGARTATRVRLELELHGGDRMSTNRQCSIGRAVVCPVGSIVPGGEASVAVAVRTSVLDVASRLVTARSDQGETSSISNVLVCTIVGTAGADRISGTPRADFICGVGGSDRIDAGAGDDRVLGTGRLRGGAGDDALLVTPGDQQRRAWEEVRSPPPNGTWLDGGVGDDLLWGKDGRELIRGGPGRDEIDGSGGSDRLLGGLGADLVNGGEGKDYLAGGDGNDSLAGHHGNDVVTGGGGDDIVRGGYFNDSNERFRPGGDDRLLGGAGRDRVVGGTGRDVVDGGSGEDQLFGGLNDDLLLARDGFVDELAGRRGFDRARVDSFDRVTGVERISGR
jgi:Ca2+-binding RTX toxin-like protein